ncbi:hypothetical protein [Streptomyces sp. NPDC000880]
MHRNTLLYRLDKIDQLSGQRVREPGGDRALSGVPGGSAGHPARVKAERAQENTKRNYNPSQGVPLLLIRAGEMTCERDCWHPVSCELAQRAIR